MTYGHALAQDPCSRGHEIYIFCRTFLDYYRNHKKLTEITTKRTETTSTSCRYMFTGFKNVTFITVIICLWFHQRICGKYETGSRHLVFIGCGIMQFTPDIKQLKFMDFIECFFFKETFSFVCLYFKDNWWILITKNYVHESGQGG